VAAAHTERITPEIYAYEVSTAGPAGTVWPYKTNTYHRGTTTMASRAALAFSLKAS